jgi:hypothetical protein
MHRLSNQELLDAYVMSLMLDLDIDFQMLIITELKRRKLTIPPIQSSKLIINTVTNQQSQRSEKSNDGRMRVAMDCSNKW